MIGYFVICVAAA